MDKWDIQHIQIFCIRLQQNNATPLVNNKLGLYINQDQDELIHYFNQDQHEETNSQRLVLQIF